MLLFGLVSPDTFRFQIAAKMPVQQPFYCSKNILPFYLKTRRQQFCQQLKIIIYQYANFWCTFAPYFWILNWAKKCQISIHSIARKTYFALVPDNYRRYNVKMLHYYTTFWSSFIDLFQLIQSDFKFRQKCPFYC